MKKVQQAKLTRNEENAYRHVTCPCPGIQEHVKKSRTPLGDIQDLVNKNQYLTVDHCQQRENVRSKSLSLYQTASPMKESSGFGHIQAESTKITPEPLFKQPLTKLPASVKVLPMQKLESRSSQKIPMRARSSSCRGPGIQIDSVKKTYVYESSSDDVFLCPISTATTKLLSFEIVMSSNSPKIILSSSQQAPDAQSNKYFTSQPQIRIPQKTNPAVPIKKVSVSTGTSNAYKARSAENLSLGKSSTISSRVSVSSTQSGKNSVTETTTQKSQDSQDLIPWYTPDLLSIKQKPNIPNPKPSVNRKQNTQQHARNSGSSRYLLNSTTKKEKQLVRSTRPTSQTDQNRCTTLPSQHFVTLTQDTLKTTINPESSYLESTTSRLSKVKVVRDSSFFSEEERTFVDGEKFFKDLEQGRRSTFKTIPVCSPLSLNVPLRRSNSVSEGETTKRVKTTLKRSSSKKIAFPLLYSPEYLENMILYSYKHRNNFILKNEWVENYVDKRCRTVTINWLLQVTELISPHFDPVYYMAVRIFDLAVIKLKLRKGHYQLAAIVAFWISLKYLDNSILLKVPKMYALCNGQYSKEQILSMERTILKAVNFCLNISDPLDFLHYFLKSSDLETNELLKYGSIFVIECATLFENYPLADPSLMAAGAIYLAYRTFLNTDDININFIWFDKKTVQRYAERVLTLNVKYAIREKYETVNKHLTPAKLQVAKEFLNI